MSDHTATPWRLDETPNASGKGPYLIFGPDPHMGPGVSTVVARAAHERVEYEANAAFIVRAVNNHEALVHKLTNCVHALTFAIAGWDEADLYIRKLRATRDGALQFLTTLDIPTLEDEASS